MKARNKTKQQLLLEVEQLRARLEEAEEALQAIRRGEVDALVVSGPEGDQIFTLKGAEQPYRVLVEEINEGALTLAADGTIFFCNSRFAEIIKTSLEKVIGTSIYNFIPAEEESKFEGLLQEGQKRSSKLEIYLNAQDGGLVPVLFSITPLPGNGVTAICAVATDLSEQKRNEQIMAAERLSRLVLEQVGETILVCDETGKIIRASLMAHWVCGKNPLLQFFDAVIPLEVSSGHDGEAKAFSIFDALKGEVRQGTEVRFTRQDGKVFHLLLSTGCLKNELDEVLGCVVILADITERKRLEEGVRRSEALLRAVIEGSEDAIYVKDRESRMLLANPATLRIVGKPAEQIVGHTDVEFYDNPAIGAAILENDRRLMDSGIPQAFEETVDTPKGRRVMLSSKVPWRESDERVIGIIGISRDITERKQAEQERERLRVDAENERRRLEAMMEALPVGIAITDAKGGTTRFNQAYDVLWGKPRPIPRNVNDYKAYKAWWPETGEPVAPEEWASARAVKKGKAVVGQLLEIQRFDGSHAYVMNSGAPIFNANGEIVGSAVAIQDITDLRRAEQALRESEERYRLAIKASNDAIWDLNLTTGTVHWNETYVASFGRPAETGNSWQWWIDHIHPEDRERTVGGVRAAIDSGADTWVCEYRFLRADGTWADIYDRAYIARDEQGKARRVVGAMQDLTKRKEMEDRIAYLASFPELNPNPIVEVDFAGSMHYLNQAAHEFFPDLQTLGVQHPWLQNWDSIVAIFLGGAKVSHVREIRIGDSWHEQLFYCIPERGSIRIYSLEITERKRTEEELKHAHELLETVTEGTKVIIAAQDNSFRYTFFNKAYAEEIKRLTGKDIHIGTSKVEVFAHMPEQQKIAVEEWSQVLRGESTSKTIEFGDPGRYGRVYNVLHTPLRDAEGNVVGAGEVAYDVTEHVRTQEALRDSEERLALALDAAELAPWGYDIVTDTVTPSSQMCKVYGIADASPLRTRADWRSFLLEEDLPTVRKAIDRADSRTGAYRVEYRVRRRSDGAVRWIASQGRLHRDAEGLPRRLVGVIADITERKQGEDALRKSEEKFELLSETASKLLATERPQEIVNELCQKVMSYLDCHAFFNYLVDEEKQCLRLNAYAGIPEEVAQEIEWLKYGVAVCGCAARDGSRIIAENIPETLDPRTDLVRSFGIKAYACHPLFARGRVIGTLSFGTRTRTRFTEDELALMKTVADQIAIAIERIQFLGELRRSREGLEVEVKKRTRDLNERVKELNCLYTISSVLDEPSLAVEKIFREIVDLIPSGWRFPEMSCARIVSQGEEIKSQNFKETSWKMSSDIIVHGKPVGAVEVYYLGEKPAGDEGPFLKEERTLIDTIATQLGEFIERKRAEEAVKLERQRFNDVLEILPAYLVLLTADYHVPFANRFFRERFGEAQGRRCFEYLFGRSEPCEICETYTALKTMAPHEWEWTGPDGRNYHVFDFPFTDTDGSTLILEMGIDITERKQAEKALKVASLYTRSLIEASLDPLVTISADGKVMDVNEATELVTGVSRENLIRSDFSSYFTDPQKAKEGYEEVFSKGFVRDYSLAIRHTSGSVTDVLYNATVYKDEAGEIQGVFAAARDITERKRAEEALKAASLYTRSLIEASLDPLVTISVDGKVMDVNKATELVTGVSREHLIGSDFSDYFSEPEKAREGYQQVFLKGSVRDYPLAIRHTSGRVTDVLYNATVYRNEAGEIQGVFAAARDITERKRAEQALQESEKQLRYLSSQLMAAQENERRRVARELHDGLGQYLTAIKFRVEGFLQETGKSRIKTKAKSLEAVIPIVQESVREIRRIQTDLRPSILDDLGILSTISWFCREFQTTYSHIRIEKEIDIREEMVPESLKMVIYRIMQEALNNISKHGQADLIRLAFRKTDGGLELSIQDNGQGFSLEEVLSAERAKQGLGLSSMRERAEHSGGSLLIESAKGKGTLIRAVWPI